MKLSDLLNELEEEEKASKTEDSINFKVLFFKLVNRWHWFAIGLFICMSAAIVHAYLATPEYYISSKLLLKDEKKGANFSDNAVISDLIGSESSTLVENEAEVLKAENLMVKVFEELGYDNSYYVPNGKYKSKEVFGHEVPINVVIEERRPFYDDGNNYLIIKITGEAGYEIITSPSGNTGKHSFGESVQNSLGTFKIEKNPDYFGPSTIDEEGISEITIMFNEPTWLGKYYASKLNVDIINKLASVIQLSMYDEHPIKGKVVMEKLIAVYNAEAETEKNLNAKNTIAFIDEQLLGLTEELEDIEKTAENYKLKNSITDFSAESELYLSGTASSRQQLSTAQIQIEVLESIESYLVSQGGDYNMVPSTLSIDDPTLTNLIADFNQLQRERERMLRTTQPSNPLVINLNQQLSSLRNSILENLRNIKKGLTISRDNLQASTNQYRNRASQVPTMERELLDISRQQGIKQEHYLFLIQKREEAMLTLAATTASKSRVIDPPTPSDYPYKPNKKLIYAFGLILGIAFPLGLVLIVDKWQEKVMFKKDVEKNTSVKILGEISRNKKNYGPIAISKNQRTLIAEQFRFLRSNLAFILNEKSNKVLAVTSGISGEGKTFFSINLAISLGLTGKKVAILEFDLRKPAMVKALNLDISVGLSELLEQKKPVEIDEVIHEIPDLENVSIISSGDVPENPSELMLGGRLDVIIDELKDRFDYIIIDTAPVGLVSDAFALSDIADAIIFMVRYNHSTLAQVKTIEDIRKKKVFKNPLIVLNDAKLDLVYGYGANSNKKYYQT